MGVQGGRLQEPILDSDPLKLEESTQDEVLINYLLIAEQQFSGKWTSRLKSDAHIRLAQCRTTKVTTSIPSEPCRFDNCRFIAVQQDSNPRRICHAP